jgi:hypothetical protein
MKDFLGDLLQDLRERRLLPVAILLVVAIVAIPVVLTQSATEPPAPVQAADVDETGGAAVLQADTADAASSSTGSSLSSFGSKDPFAPPKAITKAGTATAAEASAAGAGAAGGGTAPADGGGTAGGGDGGTAPGTTEPDVPPTKTTQYQYVADVTFWNGNNRREIRGLRKLDMLPNQASPVLIFMGTTGNGGNAVFLVDSTLSAAGEGRCVPSRGNCAFVHIGPGAEHTFTTEDGDSYRLRVDEIRRVKLSAGSADADGPSANAAVGDTDRRFTLPSLIDLVVETAPEQPAADASSNEPSSPDAGSR